MGKVAIWGGGYGYWDTVTPECLWEANAPQIGGSEATMLLTALGLAARGHDVLVGAKVPVPASYDRLRMCPVPLFPTVVWAEHLSLIHI